MITAKFKKKKNYTNLYSTKLLILKYQFISELYK